MKAYQIKLDVESGSISKQDLEKMVQEFITKLQGSEAEVLTDIELAVETLDY
jgi:excinuclease UvrABC nuclease subunit